MQDKIEAKVNDPQSYAVIDAAMAVHNGLGRGFLEAVYQDALEIELIECRIPYQREVNVPVMYRGTRL